MAPTLQHLVVDNVKIAVHYREGKATSDLTMPGLVWLGGYLSDMVGTKAMAVDAWAEKYGTSALRFDYSGHGESGGDFYQGNISLWLKQALAVFDAFTKGPQILLGSSMGGWIALRMVQELKKRGVNLAGIILLAPAPDFTETLVKPKLTQKEEDLLDTQGFFTVSTPYGEEPFSKALLDDGLRNRVMNGLIDIDCPVTILQGMKDEDVPYQHTLKLMEHLPLTDVTLTLIHDGDHRLSRMSDLALLDQALQRMVQGRPS